MTQNSSYILGQRNETLAPYFTKFNKRNVSRRRNRHRRSLEIVFFSVVQRQMSTHGLGVYLSPRPASRASVRVRCVAEENTSPLLGGHGAVNAVAEGDVRHLNIMGESVHNARPWPCYSRPAHVDSVCVCVCVCVCETLWGPALTLTTSVRGHGDSDATTSGPAMSAVRSRMLCGWGVKAGMIRYISRESKTTRNALWSRASVCLSMCLSAAVCPFYCTDPDVTWGVVGDAP